MMIDGKDVRSEPLDQRRERLKGADGESKQRWRGRAWHPRFPRLPATSITACLLESLEARGFIRRVPYRRRAIKVLHPVNRFEAFKFDPVSKSLKRSGTR